MAPMDDGPFDGEGVGRPAPAPGRGRGAVMIDDTMEVTLGVLRGLSQGLADAWDYAKGRIAELEEELEKEVTRRRGAELELERRADGAEIRADVEAGTLEAAIEQREEWRTAFAVAARERDVAVANVAQQEAIVDQLRAELVLERTKDDAGIIRNLRTTIASMGESLAMVAEKLGVEPAGADLLGVFAKIDTLKAEVERRRKRHETDTADLESMRKALHEAQGVIADMHAAAVGGVRGPYLGVVEDVAAVRAELSRALTERLLAEEECRKLRKDLEPQGVPHAE